MLYSKHISRAQALVDIAMDNILDMHINSFLQRYRYCYVRTVSKLRTVRTSPLKPPIQKTSVDFEKLTFNSYKHQQTDVSANVRLPNIDVNFTYFKEVVF